MIRAITFDCWDTLLDDDPSRNIERKEYFGQVLEENGIMILRNQIDELFAEEARLFQEHIVRHRKTRNALERAETLVDLAGARIADTEINRIAGYSDKIALEYGPPVVSGVREVLEALYGRFTLAVICNTGWHSGGTVRQLLEKCNLPGYFSHLTFSDEAGVAKPHRQIFEYTLEKIDCRPEDAVHVGDSEYSDIVGAKEIGMKAILFTGINDRYKDNNTADLTIDDYDDFVGIIERGI